MLLTIFTLTHVVISLGGILSGFVVLFGLLAGKRLEGWTAWFLATTVLTSVTGFLFPVDRFMPAYAVGILSLVLLALAIYARYARHLVGAWRKTYVATAMAALYFNVFVAIVQAFSKVPTLKSLASTQSELPFKFTQLLVLLAFVALAIFASIRFRTEPLRSASLA